MANSSFFILFASLSFLMQAQNTTLTKTRLVTGLSVPELIHLGANVDLGKYNQIGASAGVFVFYKVFPTVNMEHRFYFGKLNNDSKRTNWFFRQGGTYNIIAGDDIGGEYQGAISLSAGVDFKSKSGKNGWTIDLGGFIAFTDKNRINQSSKVWPLFRIQYYTYFKKRKID